MSKRKGELTRSTIDRYWPWQVALEERFCVGPRQRRLRHFCRDLSLGNRGHAFQRDGVFFQVFCFELREHAELFATRFNGELMHANDRPRWPGRSPPPPVKWKPPLVE